ncbi:pentatricopeptide repeat-containing protein chloroplastic [Dorcoceras hygrometricum]|uniref:Pentatricopeptide repeat-containing protein chloroplastic n=1 Tax=Dorcoceras hygrometricum TaxID=472368 RepID=A0A2Z6ZY82_9LAMI|nr:pentatricopeptide repeat-containing protein chloroplastic [Dorcoceras hygrometricum]
MMSHDGAASRDTTCALAARMFLHGGRRSGAAPAMLRQVSGDVVTAGLNSSRVWFGPVPGQPVKFRADLVGGHPKTVKNDDQDIEDRRSVKPESIVIGLHCILHYP